MDSNNCSECAECKQDKKGIFVKDLIQKYKMFLIRRKYDIKDKINGIKYKLSMNVIRKMESNSNLIKFANSEFEYLFKGDSVDKMQNLMNRNIIDILSVLSAQNHSGFSHSYLSGMLGKLMNFKPISKLTFSDDEFEKMHEDIFCGKNNILYQNKRASDIFKYSDGSFSYNSSFSRRDYMKVEEDLSIKEYDGGSWGGRFFIAMRDGSVPYIKNVRIKDPSNFNFEEFSIKSYAIEYPEGWWIPIVKESELDEFNKVYTYEYDYDMLEKEIGYKDGIYRDKLLSMIKAAIEHMNGAVIEKMVPVVDDIKVKKIRKAFKK